MNVTFTKRIASELKKALKSEGTVEEKAKKYYAASSKSVTLKNVMKIFKAHAEGTLKIIEVSNRGNNRNRKAAKKVTKQVVKQAEPAKKIFATERASKPVDIISAMETVQELLKPGQFVTISPDMISLPKMPVEAR